MSVPDLEMTDYRIDFTITRRKSGEDDFTEIGFGSSGAWATPEHAAEMIATDLQHGTWETSDGMPDPDSVMADVECAKDEG
jgi:hypothetical protein